MPNSPLINWDNSHDSAGFTSTVNPSTVNPNALPEPVSNVAAANSQLPDMRGGKKKYNKAIYRMARKTKTSKRATPKRKPKTVKYIKNRRKYTRVRRNTGRVATPCPVCGKSRRCCRNKRAHAMMTRCRRYASRGGYSQYQNNMPMTQTYATGAPLPSDASSALASPPPLHVLSNCTNCVDNYNHYTNSGFPSRGWH
jgi:hypothetical protein